MVLVMQVKYHSIFDNIVFNHQAADQRSVPLSHIVHVFLFAHANFTIATYGQTEIGFALFRNVHVE